MSASPGSSDAVRPDARMVFAFAGLAVCAAFAFALACGTRGCSVGALMRALADEPGSLAREVLWRLRVPRALAGFAVGGLLALAGALMQVLLRNPLADPYVLGVSGGASFAVVLAIWFGLGAAVQGAVAWAGAAASIALLFALGHRGLRGLDLRAAGDAPSNLLLTGVMLAAGWQALITIVMSLAPDAQLRGMLFWTIGEITGAEPWQPPALALAVALAAALLMARSLNVLLAGEARAHTLGVDVPRLRVVVCGLAAAATAFAVTTAGALGFVGLLVPHAVRRVTGNDQRLLLPVSALVGGAVVVIADTIARTVIAPSQLPVGAILSLIGVPVFLAVLQRRARAAA